MSTKKFVKISIPFILIIIYYFLSNRFFGYFCPLQAFIGPPCPASGMTRAFVLLISLNFKESFNMHPLLIPTVLIISLYFVFKLKYPKKVKTLYYPAIILIITSFLLLGYRFYYNFGEEPIVFNKNSFLMQVLEKFHT